MPKGRQKGATNRITRSMKEAFLAVYEDLQEEYKEENKDFDGENGHLINWAKKHPSDFYKIMAKMIPQQIKADVTHTVSAEDMTDDQLLSIASRSGTGAAKPKTSKTKIH